MAEKKKSEASGTMEYLLEYICDERYAASKADGTQEALNDTCDGCECGARARRLAELFFSAGALDAAAQLADTVDIVIETAWE